MNKRIRELRRRLFPEKYPLCIEKIRLTTESFRKTEGEPQVLRRAKAMANVLEGITVSIEDDELIVGNVASKPMGLEVECTLGIWSREEIEALKEEEYSISDREEEELLGLCEYWRGKSFREREAQLFDDERLWPFMQSGILCPPWKSKEELVGGGIAGGGLGLNRNLCVPDYEMAIKRGLTDIISEAKEELAAIRFMNEDAMERAYFLRSVIIADRSIIQLALRFADCAASMARECNDAARKKELEEIAEICRHVPAYPARTFREALQSFWFIYLVICGGGTPGGRFDQYMYPYYKKDIDDGRMTRDQALELIECLRIKDMQVNVTYGKKVREKWAGMAKWHNWVIGGVTREGEDATNELSYLILETAKELLTPHPTISLRVHDNTPEDLILKGLEVVKTGIGMPAFVGDKSYIGYLTGQGVPLDLARDYALAGCLDCNVPGYSRITVFGMFIVPLVLEITMNNGIEAKTGRQLGPKTGDVESFQSFDDFMKAFREQLTHFMSLTAEEHNIYMRANADLYPEPVLSSLMKDGIKAGRDIYRRVMPFENGAVLNAVGMINIADSLAAVKKLVFEEKKISMKELKKALAANWEGDGYPEMRKLCLAAPKYGNGDKYVDAIAADLYQFWAQTAETFGTFYGGSHKASAVSISTQWPGGALTGATPDGRYAGEALADGTMSPVRARDTEGPTAVMRSALCIDQTPYQATLLNMKFHPSVLKTTEDLKKLVHLIKTYLGNGGKHVQFNVIDRETLLEAQERPNDHREIVVRVAGYSAYFVQLGKVIQDDVIERTEHRTVA